MAWLLRIFLLLPIGFALLLLSISLRSGGVVPEDYRFDYFGLVQPPDTQQPPQDWQLTNSKTWVRLAQINIKNENLAQAEQLAKQALQQDPLSGRATARLLDIYETQQDQQLANEMAELTQQLWPAHTTAQLQLANYWGKQKRWDKALPFWDTLLTRNPSNRELYNSIFPQLLYLTLENGIDIIQPFIDKPPNWWYRFFYYIAYHKDFNSFPLLQQLYQARLASPSALGERERRTYTRMLIKNKRWFDAYSSWRSGLPPEQSRLNSLVHDGGFEGNTFNTGFDWSISKNKFLNIRPAYTQGVKGRRALRIQFSDRGNIIFNHVKQHLLLFPDHYRLSMNYRLDRLKNSAGLVWRIRCHNEQRTLLAETDALKGKTAWTPLKVDFDVPASDCPAQQLSLESKSNLVHHRKFKGIAWFEDINIRRFTPEEENKEEGSL